MSSFASRKIAVGMVLLAAASSIPERALAGGSLTPGEAREILRAIEPRATGPKVRLLDVIGIDGSLRSRWPKSLNSPSCQVTLANMHKLQLDRVQPNRGVLETAYTKLMQAPDTLQIAIRDAYLGGNTVTDAQVDQLAGLVLPGDNKPVAPMVFKKKGAIRGLLTGRIDESLDQTEVSRIYEGQLRQLASRDALAHPDARVTLEKYSRSGDEIDFKMTVTGPGGETPLSFRYQLKPGEKPEEVIARTGTAAVQYAGQFADPQRLTQEVNMLRYDLLKLQRLTEGALRDRMRAAIQKLESVAQSGKPGDRLMALLEAKQILIDAARSLQPTVAAAAPAASGPRRGGRGPDRPGGGQSPPPSPGRRVSPGSVGSNPSSFSSRPDDSTNMLATYAWITDPTFMLTHPWYWGVRDNNALSYLLMFEMLSHQGSRSSAPDNHFVDRAPYDPQRFNQQVDPRLYQNDQKPIVDAWDKPPLDNGVTIPVESLNQKVEPGTTAGNSSTGWFPATGAESAPREAAPRTGAAEREAPPETSDNQTSGWTSGSAAPAHEAPVEARQESVPDMSSRSEPSRDESSNSSFSSPRDESPPDMTSSRSEENG